MSYTYYHCETYSPTLAHVGYLISEPIVVTLSILCTTRVQS